MASVFSLQGWVGLCGRGWTWSGACADSASSRKRPVRVSTGPPEPRCPGPSRGQGRAPGCLSPCGAHQAPARARGLPEPGPGAGPGCGREQGWTSGRVRASRDPRRADGGGVRSQQRRLFRKGNTHPTLGVSKADVCAHSFSPWNVLGSPAVLGFLWVRSPVLPPGGGGLGPSRGPLSSLF